MGRILESFSTSTIIEAFHFCPLSVFNVTLGVWEFVIWLLLSCIVGIGCVADMVYLLDCFRLYLYKT